MSLNTSTGSGWVYLFAAVSIQYGVRLLDSRFVAALQGERHRPGEDASLLADSEQQRQVQRGVIRGHRDAQRRVLGAHTHIHTYIYNLHTESTDTELHLPANTSGRRTWQ